MAGEAIFISYRHNDTADVAGRIYDVLEARFGRVRLFKDVDDLRPGADFGEHIKTILPRCRAALILIGPNWVNATDEQGRRRLNDPNDWVRVEVELALSAGDIDVVPVLVSGACMPRPDELPSSLLPLLRRHAAMIRRDPDFRDDIARLLTALSASLGKRRAAQHAHATLSGSGTAHLIGGVAAAVVLLIALGFGVVRWLPWLVVQNVPERSATTQPTTHERPEERERTHASGSSQVLQSAEARAGQAETTPQSQRRDSSIGPEPIRAANESAFRSEIAVTGSESSAPRITSQALDPSHLVGRWQVEGAGCTALYPELNIQSASGERLSASQNMTGPLSRRTTGTYNYDVLEVRQDQMTYRRPDLNDRNRALQTLTWVYADDTILLVTNPEGPNPVRCTYVR